MPPGIYIASLVAQYGIPAVIQLLQTLSKPNITIAEAITALETLKTAQQYVNEDAAARGVPAVPLPS